MCGGWDEEGINRYNELYQKIDKDRRENPEFEDAFLQKMQSVTNVPKRKKARTTEVVNNSSMFNDLDIEISRSDDEQTPIKYDESSDDD